MPEGDVTVEPVFRKKTISPAESGVAELLNVEDHTAFMVGDNKGNFRPNDSITRAEVAQIFYRLLKDQNVQSTKKFDDVADNAWYAPAVNTLASMGILNGTSNYILSEMTSNGLDFDVALKQAQQLGYAEADPTLDIDGHDAAHKLTLLIRLAYGVNYPYTAMPVRGIRGMSSLDIALAREFGYRIKLIAQVRERREPGQPDDKVRLEAGVFPALVPYTVLLARVGGVYNAVRVSGNACGSLFFHGRGAGDLPTAGAVLADLMAVARDENPHNTGYACDDLPRASIVPPAEWRSRYYVRVMVEDEPGVLRDLAGCMADQGVSMAQVIQRTDEGKGVPLVFMTHETTEEAMSTALQRTLDTGMLRQPAVYFRVLD